MLKDLHQWGQRELPSRRGRQHHAVCRTRPARMQGLDTCPTCGFGYLLDLQRRRVPVYEDTFAVDGYVSERCREARGENVRSPMLVHRRAGPRQHAGPIEHFDEASYRLFRLSALSAILCANGDPMLVTEKCVKDGVHERRRKGTPKSNPIQPGAIMRLRAQGQKKSNTRTWRSKARAVPSGPQNTVTSAEPRCAAEGRHVHRESKGSDIVHRAE